MLPESLPENLERLVRRVDTNRFGPFEFMLGIDPYETQLKLQRIADVYESFSDSPLSEVASSLEREVVVSSVYSTNTIEGGALSEDETDAALRSDPNHVSEHEKRRAINIKAAYDFSLKEAANPSWKLSLEFVVEVHRLISRGLPSEEYQQGVLRDNPKDRVTHVGDIAHGGRYKPPQNGKDIRLLLDTLIEWHDTLIEEGVHPLVRAPLIHLYYELIHPFWDGNGRVGRVVEATILLSAGYRYAPFALARYYLNHIDSYFTLFNTCRKNIEKGKPFPNQPFVGFYLDGMYITIKALHKRANRLVSVILFQANIGLLLEKKRINSRQYTILTQLLTQGPAKASDIRHAPWYASLYLKLNDKTRQRDLSRLRELELIYLDDEDKVWASCFIAANSRRDCPTV